MARISQIKAVLLEESLMFLLRDSAYLPVENVPNINASDKYLDNAANGLNVLGRGEKHQIDAIADFLLSPPFTNPLRLLCEAKYHESALVGIEVIRNAVGVKKDVEEFFRPMVTGMPLYRHHYQYVVVSSTGFTGPAQNYAFAQDIYLLDLSADVYETHFLEAIDAYVEAVILEPLRNRGHRVNWNTDIAINLPLLRSEFRAAMENLHGN